MGARQARCRRNRPEITTHDGVNFQLSRHFPLAPSQALACAALRRPRRAGDRSCQGQNREHFVNRRQFLTTSGATALAASAPRAFAQPGSQDARLRTMLDGFFYERLDDSPEQATRLGLDTGARAASAATPAPAALPATLPGPRRRRSSLPASTVRRSARPASSTMMSSPISSTARSVASVSPMARRRDAMRPISSAS